MLTAESLLGIAGMLAAAVVLLGVLRRAQVAYRLDPEFVRKLFHVGGGFLGLALPWLFEDILPVLILGVLVAVLFYLLRAVPPLRATLGQVFLGINRRTGGDFFLIAGFALLFWLARGDKLLYSIPLLVVTLADALAALIGHAYGKFPLHMHGDKKTIEGALSFLFVAYLCIHVPVLLSEQTGRVESLLIALDISFMVMLAEAAAWWGLDNLVVPLLAYMALKSMLAMDDAALVAHLAFVLTLSAILFVFRKYTTLGDDALAGGVLWGYVVWAVGGWTWVLPPLLQVMYYANVTAPTPRERLRDLGFPVVLANIVGSIFWLLVYRETGDERTFVAFVACYSCNMSIVTLVRKLYLQPDQSPLLAACYGVGTGMLITVPPLAAVFGLSKTAAIGALAVLVAVVGATFVFQRVQPFLTRYPVDMTRQVRQAVIVTAASGVAFGSVVGQLWMLQNLES